MLNDFTPSGVAQLNLIDDFQLRAKSKSLMQVIEDINQTGMGNIWFVGRGIVPAWQIKLEMLS